MAILVNHSVLFPGRVDDIINHPDGGEQEEDDEEHLQVRAADLHIVVGAAAHQGTAQDQDVDTDDPRQHPSPVPSPLLRHPDGGDVQVGLARAPLSARQVDVVGQVGLLCLPVFGRHPARFTGIAIGQTVARVASVQTHPSPL